MKKSYEKATAAPAPTESTTLDESITTFGRNCVELQELRGMEGELLAPDARLWLDGRVHDLTKGLGAAAATGPVAPHLHDES